MRDHIDDRIADADDINRGGIHRHGSPGRGLEGGGV
jgi:hypothetical protein